MEGQEVQAELACNEAGPLAQWAEARGLPVHSLAMASPFDRGAVKALAALCRDRKIDVIHTHYLRENYIALQAKGKVPDLRVVYTYHILTQNSLAQRVCNRLLSRRQDAVVANCTAGARQLVANGIPQDQIHLIYNAVDPTQWQDPATTLRQEIGAEAGDFVLLFAARLVEGKGHAFLLESLAQLRENTAHPFRLVLAGEGPLRQDLEAQTRKNTFLTALMDVENLEYQAPNAQQLVQTAIDRLPLVADYQEAVSYSQRLEAAIARISTLPTAAEWKMMEDKKAEEEAKKQAQEQQQLQSRQAQLQSFLTQERMKWSISSPVIAGPGVPSGEAGTPSGPLPAGPGNEKQNPAAQAEGGSAE